jgi:methionyl-tRNA synthetase
MPDAPKRWLVTSALPYANGPIHFGHLAGAYLNADIFVRYKRLTGADVLYICGTDEHGAPILVNAEKARQTPGEFTDHWHREIKDSFDRANIRFDHFSRTSRPIHHERTQHFFRRLDQHGFVTTKLEDQLFCETCKIGLPDRYVTGTCPVCQTPGSRGDECPKGHTFEATDLIDPVCRTCGKPASKRPAKHWYLDLPKLQSELGPWLESKFPSWRPNVVGEVKKFLQTLKPRNITRDLSWGVKVPLDEARDKVFYVWFDAPIGYVSATQEWAKEKGLPADAWKTWWQDEGTQLVHFIGKDNIAFHTVIFPAMLLGQREGYVLPDVPANEFLNLEGKKFSTSGGWYIQIDEFLAKYPADTLRWTLTRSAPETRDADFSYRDWQKCVNAELLGTFGNLASRVLKFVQSKYAGTIPAAQAPLGGPERRALDALAAGVAKASAQLDQYSTRGGAEEVLQVGFAANKLIEERQPFKLIATDPALAATAVNTAARLIEGLAILLQPFVPETSNKLWKQLGLPGAPTDRRWSSAAEIADPSGRAVGPLDEHLFQRVEDKTVEAEVKALQERAAKATAAQPAKEAPKPEPAKGEKKAEAPSGPKPNITYEQFQAMDLRIAKVLAAEAVPKADKLLKLTLELAGGEKRTVVSGIKAWYAPEALVGRQVVYLANLEPRKLRGVESQGMILAANDVGDVAVLLQAERPVPDGARVS